MDPTLLKNHEFVLDLIKTNAAIIYSDLLQNLLRDEKFLHKLKDMLSDKEVL